MASGRQVEYSLRLNSNAVSVLGQADIAANKFDNSMWQVQKTLASFGLGLGAHFLIDAAKDWTQAAADYEQAMLRIKNASKTDEIGVFNESFLNTQVDKFKTKLQETADAYGNFLFKIRNANLNNDVSNRLFENISLISKVGGIPQDQMDSQIRNIGILLGEGVLEARHLRQLSYVDPQIVPFLAQALGLKDNEATQLSGILNKDVSEETAQQQFAQMISSGKLTKSALKSDIIIDAIELQRKSLEGKLPETLHTLNSELNDFSNALVRFKNSMVLDNKPELLGFINDIKGDIHWLSEHEEGIIKVGKAIFEVIKLYAEWRLALVAIQAPLAIVSFFTNEQQRLNSVIDSYKTKSIVVNQELIETNNELSNSNITLLSTSNNLDNLRIKEIQLDNIYAENKISLTDQMILHEAAYNEQQLKNFYIRLEVSERNLIEEQAIKEKILFVQQNFNNLEQQYLNENESANIEYNAIRKEILDSRAKNYGELTEVQIAMMAELDRVEEERILNHEIKLSALRDESIAQQSLYNQNLSILQNENIRKLSEIGNLEVSNQAEFNNSMQLLRASDLSSSEAYANEKQLINEQMLYQQSIINAGLIANPIGTTNLSIGLAGASLGSTGLLAGIGSGLASAAMPVAVVWMAGSIIDGMVGKIGNTGVDFNIWDLANPQSKGFWNQIFAIKKASSDSDYQEALDHLNYEESKKKKGSLIDERNLGLFSLDKLLGLNGVFDPYTIYDPNDHFSVFSKSKSGTSSGISNPTKPEHIRGNSSNYFSVHIQTMNGINKLDIKEASKETIEDIKQEVGTEIDRMLTEVINDIQVSHNEH